MSLPPPPPQLCGHKRKKTSESEPQTPPVSPRYLRKALEEYRAGNSTGNAELPLVMSGSEFGEMIDRMLDRIEQKLDAPQALAFSAVTDDDLDGLNIYRGGTLTSKPDREARAERANDLGRTEHWSAQGLYQHLVALQGIAPQANAAAAHTWIEPFFFRAAAMSLSGKKLVLGLEQSVPPIAMTSSSATIADGFIDYLIVSTCETGASFLSHEPTRILQDLRKGDQALFVFKAKDTPPEFHIPQAVCAMYACAKRLKKSIIRGAVTEGRNWIFLILRMNADGNGAAYLKSNKLCFMTSTFLCQEDVSPIMCSTIAGIIAHWVEHSYEKIGDDDWFNVEWWNIAS